MEAEQADLSNIQPAEAGHSTASESQAAPEKAKPVKRPPKAIDEPGKTILPAARVSRIIKADRDIEILSKDAIFLISIAAEHFIKKLTEAAYFHARQGQRKGVQYKDLATAIQNDETYFYLQEVIPPPTALKEALNKRRKKLAADNGVLTDDEDAAEKETVTMAPTLHPTLASTSPAVHRANGQVFASSSMSPETQRTNGHSSMPPPSTSEVPQQAAPESMPTAPESMQTEPAQSQLRQVDMEDLA